MTAFRHVEAGRVIVFGPDARRSGAELIGAGFTLLTTARAARAAPDVVERAGTVVEVPSGLVENLAGDLLGAVDGQIRDGLALLQELGAFDSAPRAARAVVSRVKPAPISSAPERRASGPKTITRPASTRRSSWSAA